MKLFPLFLLLLSLHGAHAQVSTRADSVKLWKKEALRRDSTLRAIRLKNQAYFDSVDRPRAATRAAQLNNTASERAKIHGYKELVSPVVGTPMPRKVRPSTRKK